MPITINGSGTVTGISVGGLPDGIVDTDMIASSVSLGGLTVAEQWCLTSANDGDVSPITGWTKPSNHGRSTFGTGGMTESSGIFTFGSNGYWIVSGSFNVTHKADQRYHEIQLWTSTDGGSNWNRSANGVSSAGTRPGGNTCLDSLEVKTMMDVTNYSNFKVKFISNTADSSDIWHGTDANESTAWFLKVGDT